MMIAAVLVIFMMVGQIFVKLIADDYKQNMIEHDYAVAGYLDRNGVDSFQITRAFIHEKILADRKAGQELLQVAAYHVGTQNNLIPEVDRFHQKYALLFVMLSGLFSIAILGGLWLFAVRQNKRLQKVNMDISSFMDGHIYMRLEDVGEGSLSKLFASVNKMATSLTSHIIKEKRSKEFLKDTISDISHQLKTPLAALQMYNEIMQDEKTGNEVVDDFILKSERELKRIENLIQNLLKLARLDAGAIELEKNTHILKKFLEEVIGRFSTCAELEGKMITLDCDDRLVLAFDEEWLLEAVSNIIKNALDHTNSGDRIDLQCEATPVTTEITIKDTGTGIHLRISIIFLRGFTEAVIQRINMESGLGLLSPKPSLKNMVG